MCFSFGKSVGGKKGSLGSNCHRTTFSVCLLRKNAKIVTTFAHHVAWVVRQSSLTAGPLFHKGQMLALLSATFTLSQKHFQLERVGVGWQGITPFEHARTPPRDHELLLPSIDMNP